MKIVIDIDEDLYKSIIGHRCKIKFQQRCDYEDLKNAIEDGTPLPKGHGRLIDESDLIPDSDYEDGTFYSVSIGAINGAPTIIEADRSDGYD